MEATAQACPRESGPFRGELNSSRIDANTATRLPNELHTKYSQNHLFCSLQFPVGLFIHEARFFIQTGGNGDGGSRLYWWVHVVVHFFDTLKNRDWNTK